MRILGPVVSDLCYPGAHGLHLLPRNLLAEADAVAVVAFGGGCLRRVDAGRVDTHKVYARGREAEGGAVAVDDAAALEGVADDCETAGPGMVLSPEEYEGKEDVIIRVQGAFLQQDARGGCGVSIAWRQETEVFVCRGEIGVAGGFGDGRFTASGTTGNKYQSQYGSAYREWEGVCFSSHPPLKEFL